MIEKRSYSAVELPQTEATAEMIIARSLDGEIRERMMRTVEAEGPIMRPLLFKRVIASFSLKKVGSRIEPVFREIAASLPFQVTMDDGEEVYHSGCDEQIADTRNDRNHQDNALDSISVLGLGLGIVIEEGE